MRISISKEKVKKNRFKMMANVKFCVRTTKEAESLFKKVPTEAISQELALLGIVVLVTDGKKIHMLKPEDVTVELRDNEIR